MSSQDSSRPLSGSERFRHFLRMSARDAAINVAAMVTIVAIFVALVGAAGFNAALHKSPIMRHSITSIKAPELPPQCVKFNDEHIYDASTVIGVTFITPEGARKVIVDVDEKVKCPKDHFGVFLQDMQ